MSPSCWVFVVGLFFSFVFKKYLKNVFQLPGRKEPERKREQRKTVEIFN